MHRQFENNVDVTSTCKARRYKKHSVFRQRVRLFASRASFRLVLLSAIVEMALAYVDVFPETIGDAVLVLVERLIGIVIVMALRIDR